MRKLLTLSLCIVAIGCAAEVDEMTKDEARASVGKGDHFDFCAWFDWYGDGICDDFCASPDPDCASDPYCYSDSDCDDGLSCNAAEVCLSPCAPGQVCAAVCAGFCVEAPEPEPEQMCGGFAGFPCDEGEYCDYGDMCHIADGAGVCKPKPDACAEIYAPVCGCDGETYSNECDAAANGATVEYDGECGKTGQLCGGRLGATCGDDEYCEFFSSATSCGFADGAGTCTERPEFCPAVVTPVCGCDGTTYNNSCEAARAGTDVLEDGACAQ